MLRSLALVALLVGCGGASKPHAVTHGGTAIVVVRGDDVVRASAEGDLTPASVVPLASLSKHLWGAAALQLVAAGKLALDAPVARYLPKFPDARVRVRDVLQQTSGLGDDDDGEDDREFSDAKVAFEPGTWWHYSNRGAILARRLVEVASGQSWDAYGRAHFGIGACGAHVPLYDAHGAPAGLPDATMARVQFACGSALEVARFLRTTQIAAMRTPVEVGGTGPLPYGLLTRIADVGGHVGYGHTGNFPGVSVAAFEFPAEALTIVVVENRTPATPDASAPAIALRLAREQLHVPADVARPAPPELLAAIAGDYDADGARGRTEIVDGTAWLVLGPARFPLQWYGGRRFGGVPDGKEITYVPATGDVVGAAIGTPLLLDVLARRVRPGS